MELRVLPIDKDVDVPAQRRAGLAQAIPETGPPLLERVEQLLHRGGRQLEPARQTGEQRRQGRRKSDVGHPQASTTATSTEAIDGR